MKKVDTGRNACELAQDSVLDQCFHQLLRMRYVGLIQVGVKSTAVAVCVPGCRKFVVSVNSLEYYSPTLGKVSNEFKETTNR